MESKIAEFSIANFSITEIAAIIQCSAIVIGGIFTLAHYVYKASRASSFERYTEGSKLTPYLSGMLIVSVILSVITLVPFVIGYITDQVTGPLPNVVLLSVNIVFIFITWFLFSRSKSKNMRSIELSRVYFYIFILSLINNVSITTIYSSQIKLFVIVYECLITTLFSIPALLSVQNWLERGIKKPIMTFILEDCQRRLYFDPPSPV